MERTATNQDFQKRHNRALVLQTIRQRGAVSRVDLAHALGLKKSSVTNIVGELIKAGVVQEMEGTTARHGSGRRPVPLMLRSDVAHILGVELQAGRYDAVVMDMKGSVVWRHRGDFVGGERDFRRVCIDVLAFAQKQAERAGFPISAISVGMPGYIDSRRGRVIYSEPHDLCDFDFAEQVATLFDVPIAVENDANCGAWGELELAKGGAVSDFLFLLGEFQRPVASGRGVPGFSVGFGLVLRGMVYTGSSHSAGDFKSLFWKAGNQSQVGIPDERMHAIHNDPAGFRDYLVELLQNLSPLVSVLDPSFIVLGGDLAELQSEIAELIEQDLKGSYLASRATGAFFSPARHGTRAVAAGAAGRLVEEVFTGIWRYGNASEPQLSWEALVDFGDQVWAGGATVVGPARAGG